MQGNVVGLRGSGPWQSYPVIQHFVSPKPLNLRLCTVLYISWMHGSSSLRLPYPHGPPYHVYVLGTYAPMTALVLN